MQRYIARNAGLGIACLLACGMAVSCTAEESERTTMNIRITIGDTVLAATLEDSEASRDFASMFPLKLKMTDYANTEKISQLPKRLSTQSSPAGCDPSTGDVTYYAPWGNLAVFYRDFGYADGLVKLGRLSGDGAAQLAKMKGEFDALFELIDE